MHGIVHKTLEQYVVDRADEDAWDRIIDRADVEPTLYLQVSHYDDDEIDAILETLASMAGEDRHAIEQDFGRALAPELLSTFGAHVRNDWGVLELLDEIETLRTAVENASADVELPEVMSRRAGTEVHVTYSTHRDPTYCRLAHGILEGLVTAFDEDGTVTEEECVHEGGTTCRFLVTID